MPGTSRGVGTTEWIKRKRIIFGYALDILGFCMDIYLSVTTLDAGDRNTGTFIRTMVRDDFPSLRYD